MFILNKNLKTQDKNVNFCELTNDIKHKFTFLLWILSFLNKWTCDDGQLHRNMQCLGK
jgi:hypothetical protein